MNAIIKEWIDNEKSQEYLSEVENKKGPIVLSGLSDVGKIIVAAATAQTIKRPICIITYNEIQAKKLVKDFSYFTDQVLYFPKREIVSYDYLAESKDLPYERMEVLNAIYDKKAPVIVTTIEAVMQKMIAKEILYQNVLDFKIGDNNSIEKIKEKLIALGYERTEIAETKGSFCVRGGIIDIALSSIKGVRIEFWGEEIDSIRYFSIASQRSTDMIQQIRIYPAHEFLLEKAIPEVISCLKARHFTAKQQELVSQEIELMENGEYISKIDKYFTCFYSKIVSFLEYLSTNTILFLDEVTKIKARVQNIQKDNKTACEALVEKEKIVPDAMYLKEEEEINLLLEKRKLVLLERQDTSIARKNAYHFTFREVNYYKNTMDLLFSDIEQSIKQNKKILILGGNKQNSEKIANLLTQKDIVNTYLPEGKDYDLTKGKVIVSCGGFSEGFECYDLGLIVMTGEELFGENKRKRKQVSTAFKEGEKVVFADLVPGDFVVHKMQGIGKFIGVNTITADGITKDYMKIQYKGEDVLYVPTNNLDSIRKYVGGGEVAPKLNRLGSKEWSNTKAKVKNNLREVARELIELYAKRQKIKGYAFSKDTPWQQQFEESFPYTETQDQLRCIEEVKKDMEEPKPMDRLLCGDVGYGKTEVAIRAAFKACMDQKQVAYLVPTTVLADQQYTSFLERMQDFPIRIALLNRFKTKKEQEQIVKKLKLGEIDIVIGTHRILSNDVEFKELGLLIVDEEHRFGVKDKEKIKQLKENVDVLTMTATPIPRTLHMSIVGVRDMSVIYEPPQNRRPVQTYVLEQDEEVIQEAIMKELERDGQVFYLFNNVEGIERKAEHIADLVPEAKVAFAHGKMTGKQLEDMMLSFIQKKINVLVCTTILESGIDIPNANTIIVENADRLGLAQLYQIRGRVGRSDKQAYAYITYKRDKMLSEVADKRLKAIKEFTEFGSGFKIAMRDLEIRGAGSLLRRNAAWPYGTSRI